MGSKKSFVKGIAAGAILAAAASIIMDMREDNSAHAKEFKKTAKDIGTRVSKRALKLGKLSKTAYKNIVDVTIDEYRGVKALSEDELLELRVELLDGWDDLSSLVKKKPAKKSVAKKRKR